ncbi:MAG TPA: hypothetical protein DD381_14435 [Lentisphaeria bacterium]|nr:MAG: hypothetical protein A2X47_00835 [Lentisphaerae bacterium GWF2_38_69]HBM17523.1 hypothetical protein [Lentisphaeria bacterium]
MVGIIKGTPMWVWVVLVLVIYKGIKMLSDNTLAIKKLLIMPVLFLILTVNHVEDPFIYGVFLMIGAMVGAAIYSRSKLRIDRENKLIRVPGSALALVLIVLIFAKGYFFGYEHAVHPEFFKNALFLAVTYIVSGCFTGIIIGKAAIYYYRFLKLPSEDLSSTVEVKRRR